MRKAFDLKPLGFNDVMGRSFSLYASAFMPFARWFLLAWTLPMLLLMALLYFALDPYSTAGMIEEESIWQAGGYASYYWLLKLAALVLGFSVGASGLYYIGARHYVGGKPGLGEVARAIAARAGHLVGTSTLNVLILLAMTLVCFGLPVLMIVDGDAFEGFLLMFLLSFLWVPAIGTYLGFWGMSVGCVTLDDASTPEAFSRSAFLSKGFRLRFVGMVAVGMLVVGAPGVPGLMTIPALVLQPLLADRGIAVIGDLVRVAWEGLLLPLFFLPLVPYYFDMRCRKEGYDLAVMARNFGIEEGEMMRYRMNPHAGYMPPGYKPERGRGMRPPTPAPPPQPIVAPAVAIKPEWAAQPPLRLPRRRQ